jgi:hypothetical protein
VVIVPKLRKDKRDEVIKLLNEGYIKSEIHEKTGVSRGTISKIEKEINIEKKLNKSSTKTTGYELSQESLTKIGYMQGMYGAKTHDEAIATIYEDIRVLMKLKYKYDDNPEKKLSQVFKETLLDFDSGDFLSKVNKARGSFFHQMIVLILLGIDPAVKAFYDITRPPDTHTVLEFMERAVIGSFENKGWNVRYYWNEILKEKMPIITDPFGREFKFPLLDE